MATLMPFVYEYGTTGKALTLSAKLINAADLSQNGSDISGWIERATSGIYVKTISIPDGFNGYVEMYDNGTLLDSITIDPQESANVAIVPTGATFAEQMVAQLQQALKENPTGVVTVNVDGTNISYSNRNELLNELNHWQREVARANGKRPIAMGINLSNF